MCRFIAYLGTDLLLADLISGPANSLIRQSYKSRERSEPLNGDGFGLGWYVPEISKEPCVFTSITPAWSNRNLDDLIKHTRSPCLFAHVRAASPGMQVSEANCHPFRNGRFLWMHNGTIECFTKIKRRLMNSLPDRLYHSIQGTTDSEHAFAVFINALQKKPKPWNTGDLSQALVETIDLIQEWVVSTNPERPSMYNFAVTDGRSIAAARYTSNPRLEPISLYFKETRAAGFEPFSRPGVVITSEKLTDEKRAWTRVAPNHILTVGPDLAVGVEQIPI